MRSSRTLESFVGSWRCTSTDGMDAYLQYLGVNSFSRALAVSIVPTPRISLEHRRLQIATDTPVGGRVEWLNVDAVEADSDPQGRSFSKVVAWRGNVLVSSFTCTDKPSSLLALRSNIVTERWLDDSGRLHQLTTYESASFRRLYERVP